jgi:hypothetical protein
MQCAASSGKGDSKGYGVETGYGSLVSCSARDSVERNTAGEGSKRERAEQNARRGSRPSRERRSSPQQQLVPRRLRLSRGGPGEISRRRRVIACRIKRTSNGVALVRYIRAGRDHVQETGDCMSLTRAVLRGARLAVGPLMGQVLEAAARVRHPLGSRLSESMES